MLHSHTMKMGGVFKRTAAAPLNQVDVTVPVQAFRPPIEGTEYCGRMVRKARL